MMTITATSQDVWKRADITDFRSVSEEDKMIMPSEYQSYTLSFNDMKNHLSEAPLEDLSTATDRGLLVQLPMDDGSIETFEVFDAPVMAPKLAAKYYMIKSYKGVSTNSKSKNVRIDIGPYGLHAAIHSPNRVVYIDPYARGHQDQYLVYDVADHMSQIDLPVPFCGVQDDLKDVQTYDVTQTRGSSVNIPLRVYRLAIACTGEWGAQRGTVENAMADIVTGVNRLNQIFENELALRMVLVEDNDKLLHFDSTMDPYGNVASGGAMLSVNTGAINERIGINSYDIGHVYHRSCDVGGIARLGSLCDLGSKGAGVTCHYSNNLDYMAASVTSHEIGHQMSAQHTFNHCDGENESLGNGFEPGSGSTIMSYGGLCGGDLNIQGGSDDYYHVASLIQIYNHTRNGGSADGCAEIINTSNEEPVITLNYENNIAIPAQTYFFLKGSATDANNDALTYSWEGFNAGPLSPLGSPIGTAPRFRVFPPSPSPIRYFPQPFRILSGQFDRNEVLPDGDMNLDFVFVVRDNNAEAGTAVYEQMRLRSIATPEKFGITSQNIGPIDFVAGQSVEVTWNVATTDLSPINQPTMDIYFHDAYEEFDFDNMTILAKNAKNDGSAIVTVPNTITDRGRFIIKASNGNFFSINARYFDVESPTEPAISCTPFPGRQIVCFPNAGDFTLNTTGLAGIQGPVRFEVIEGLPASAIATFSPETVTPGESTQLDIVFDDFSATDEYALTILAIVEGVDTFTTYVDLATTSTDHSLMQGLEPADGASSVGVAPAYEWSPSPNADTYTLQVATNPSFSANSLVLSVPNLQDTEYETSELLDKKTTYYWRVLPSNSCGDGKASKVRAFNTEVLACAEFEPEEDGLPINISQSGLPTIEAEIFVTGGSIADVNVLEFQGEHDNNKDMIVSLISPLGTTVTMFSKICNQSDFNCAFDDASNTLVKCPLNNGLTYRPIVPLSTFNGELAEGIWKLRIEDTSAGNGGRLEKVKLQVCASQTVESPFIVNNEKLVLGWGDKPTINSSILSVSDNDTDDATLTYTIVQLPTRGALRYDGSPVAIGDQFTQADIDGNKLTYDASFENYFSFFSFTVIDNEGGFLGITNFYIEVNDPNSTYDPQMANAVSVYPVPATDRLTVDLSASSTIFHTLELHQIDGTMVSSRSINNATESIDVSTLHSGVYILTLRNDQYTIAKKVVIK